MKHQSVQVLQGGEVGGHCDRVARQVDVFEVNILIEVLHGLDVVVGEVEPREQVDVLQALDGDQAVRREVKNLEVVEFCHLEHPNQLIVRCGELFKALVGVDVVEPGELVVVEEEGGRVQDQLRGGPGQLLHLPLGEVQGVRVPHHTRPRFGALQTDFLLRHLCHHAKDHASIVWSVCSNSKSVLILVNMASSSTQMFVTLLGKAQSRLLVEDSSQLERDW